ncbi:MAG: disulfide bond formation protein B [Candidatus Staskawiczbacteria bacterium]|nr:disulfide bond formation protein B [Candidatus Staskawiczbacteria bacterium]
MLLEIINKVLATGAIISQIFIVLALIYILLPYKQQKISEFFSGNGIKLAFVCACLATAGSLFYSNYAGFEPCPLCWFQRIFMYPQVILLGLALFKKDKNIIDYSLALSIIGVVISIYHNYIVINGLHSTVCTISEPCTINYVLEFGYITIPAMALTAFLLIILLLMSQKTWQKKISVN